MTETPPELATETKPRLDPIEPPASPRADNEAGPQVALGLARTITTSAGYLGLERVEALAAAVNGVLSGADGDTAWASPRVRALVHEATTQIKVLLRAVEGTGAEPEGDDAELMAHLNAAATTTAGTAALPKGAHPSDTRIDKFMFGLRTVGLARTLQRSLQTLVPAWVFDANKLAICETDLSEWLGAAPAPEWNYRWATRTDTELLTSQGGSADEVERFFDHGGQGTILEISGKLIANNWVIPDQWTCFDWIRFELGPTELYGASSFVAAEYRGRRARHQTRSFAYGCIAGQGYERVYTTIEALNRSSLRASAHKPRRHLGYLSYVRLFGLIVFRLGGTWRAGFWNNRHPFTLTHDVLHAGQDTGSAPAAALLTTASRRAM